MCTTLRCFRTARSRELTRSGAGRALSQIEVNGDNVHPVYQFLKTSKTGLLGLTRIKWNFEARPHLAISPPRTRAPSAKLTFACVQKFLVDKQGIPYERYASITKPEAMEARSVQLARATRVCSADDAHVRACIAIAQADIEKLLAQ